MNSIKKVIKVLIPFYSSFVKSASSGVHNQSYWNYIRFRLIGSCGRGGGGIIQFIRHVRLQMQERSMWVVTHQ